MIREMRMADDYKARAKKMGEQRKEKANITLKEGDNCLRVLPTPAGKTSPEVVMEYQVHYEVGPNKVTCRCGHEPGSDDGDCWLCDKKAEELRKAGKAGRAEKLAPSVCVVVMASVVTEDDDGKIEFGKPKPWRPSGKVAGTLMTQILASKKRDYVHLKKGYNINISRTGSGFKDTRYGPIEPDDEPSKVPSAIVKLLKPFDAVINEYNEDQQKAAYAGKEYTPEDSSSDSGSSEEESASVESESGLEDVLDSSNESGEESSDDKKKKKVKKKKKEESSEEESSEEEMEGSSDDRVKKKKKK